VTVNDVAPTVTFADPPAVAGSPVSFTANATDVSPAVQAAGFTYAWTFGDGSTGTGATVSHTYASAGTYAVTVSATDEYGKTGTTTGSITILSAPVVNAGSPVAVNAESSLTFSQATETGGTAPFTYTWNFGDGTNQTGSLNPSHTYANPGSYTATVNVTDANQLTSTSSVVVTVNDVAPTASLSGPSSGTAGTSLSFTASATDVSPAVQAAGFTYAWNFGDGSTGTGASASHSFASTGTYTVAVTAKDEYGKTGTSSETIVVSSSSALTVSAGSNLTTNAGSTVTFAGSVSGGTAPYSYSWNFGDGTTSTGNSASFVQTDTTTQGNWTGVYGAAGYNVIGSTSSYPSYATVTPSGQALWTWSSTTSDVRGLLIPGSTSRIAACWYSSTSFTIDVNLTDGQVHPVSLYAVDWYSQGFSEQIQVLDGSSGAVLNSQTISNFSGGEYLTWNVSGHVQFKVTTLAGANGVVSGLFIGAGSTAGANTLTPSHVYANPGTYIATLTATDSAGHSGSSSTTVTVNDVAPTVTFTDPPATVGVPVSFTASATDISPAVQAAGFTYAWNFGEGTTGTGASATHTYTSAGTYTVSVTATDMYGTISQPATATMTVSNASQTGVYYVAPNATSGDGTFADPFGMPDLINTTAEPYVTPGPALTILRPGDTLYFLAGTYNISGSTNPAYYGGVMLCPTTSGTSTQPITISAYPGATVNINEVSGDQPVFGTCYPVLNYVRFLGFTITMGPGVPIPADNNALDAAPAFYIGGTGNEVGYCTVIGSYMPTSDNHDGIRIEHANDSWIHHNIITGVKGNSQNSAGIKLYTSTNTIISDNYIYGCTTGMVDKFAHSPDNTTNSTYTRNFVTDCPYAPFLGNGYAAQANFYIYDNVFDGNVNLGALNTDSQVYNNLIRNATQVFNGQLKFYNVSIWNNIAISRGPAITAFVDESVAFVPRGSRAPLQYIDYNVYDRAPSYSFGSYASQKRVFNLSQMRARGFEQHARVVRSDLTIFQDLTSYQLRPQWTTAGRNGDPVGPRFPIAKILDTSRYGPQALGTGSSPIFTQRPENQSAAVGGRATFSVRVSASGLLYQWQRSNDGGKTWITIQSANSAVYTIPQVATSDNGTVFRCLAACIGGSVWSDTATLSVNAAAAPLTTQPSP